MIKQSWFKLYRPAHKAFMEEDGLVSLFRDPANGNVEPLEMIGNVIRVERPEILLVCEQVHDLRLVRIIGTRFERGHRPFDGNRIADDVDLGENDAAIEIHQRIMTGKILGTDIVQKVVHVPSGAAPSEITAQYANVALVKRL